MTQQPLYDSHNPRPLSQMRTELMWEGKYIACVKVVDIFGCDTSITVEVEV
jgi:adenine-specific DNA-methyltransferase